MILVTACMHKIALNFFVIRWIWQSFQFLLEHITQMPRRTMASFSTRLEPAAAAGGAPPDAPVPEAPVLEAPEDVPPAAIKASQPTHDKSSSVRTNPDLVMGLLENFLTERQTQVQPAIAFGSYVDGSLRSLPSAIRRTAEARIMEVLHESQNEADRQLQFRPVPKQPAPADRQPPKYRQLSAQHRSCRPRESPDQHWQPPPSQWPAGVTNPPTVWHPMDRPWAQDQFPEMNFNQPQPQPSSTPRHRRQFKTFRTTGWSGPTPSPPYWVT